MSTSPTLLNQFQSFLLGSKHISPSTVKNYISDINHFLSFVSTSIQEPEIKPSHITPAIITAYRQSLTQPSPIATANPATATTTNQSTTPNNQPTNQTKATKLQTSANTITATNPNNQANYNQISPASINRKLSSLRRFGQFLADTKLLDSNPAQAVINLDIDPTLTQVISHYKKHLETEELSRSTIKNYVSDLKKYLLWAQRNIKTTDNNLNQRKLN